MKKQWKTACPLNCYDVCGFIVTTEDNKLISIDGDHDHPVTQGKICGKGKMIKDRIYDPRRILYPQKRIGEGQFVRISWDQAIEEISNKMLAIRDKYGPTAILHSYDYASGGLLKELDQRFFNYFGGMTKVIGSLCWGAGIKAQEYDLGNSLSHDVTDILNARTIIVWGRNVTTTNMHLLPFIQEAKKEGVKLIVIDPMKNNIAKLADMYISIKPGMDGNLALAISKIIIDNNWHDKEFIQKNTVGFSELMKELNSIDIEKISKEIKIEVSIMQELAKTFKNNNPVTVFLGLGMQRYRNGGNTIRAIDALFGLTGNIGVSGGGVNYANLNVGKSFNFDELIRNDLGKEQRTFKRPSQADEILEANTPPIKMAFISRSNAVVQLPSIAKTMKAFKSIDTMVVIDMYMTETAKIADYVLPTTSVFEEEDIYYGSMFHGIIRFGPKLIEPPGEAWSDLKIWSSLAKKMNLDGFTKTIDEYLGIALKPLNRFGINLKNLKDVGQARLPILNIPWEIKSFDTPSGKFEFYSQQAKDDGLSPIAKIDYPEMVNDKKYPYNLITIHPVRSLHSQHYLIHKKDKPSITISEKIAETKELKNGDEIKIYNDQGEIDGIVKINVGNQEDTIIIEEGRWVESGGAVNKLTSNRLSDMGNGSVLFDCTVDIKKYKMNVE